MLKIFKIKGYSLSPILEEGDYVLVLKKFFNLKENDIVLFKHHKYGTLIKKIERVISSDKYFVVGTHKESTDSRIFGEIDRKSIIGKVVFKIKS